ncbi:thiocillin family RiPP [Kitasatospora sp. NPDC056531]|uniref:thiocillin family RiPP n=1 Tax=Kitasatospora sp. NPDC056531 TaxID=3345856 RepID=UPI0036BDC144
MNSVSDIAVSDLGDEGFLIEELPETIGFNCLGTISSAGTVGGCLGSASTVGSN